MAAKYPIAECIEAVQKYLKKNSLSDMEKNLGIRARDDEHHIILNYKMTEANFNEPYAHVCRGLILDKSNLDVLGFGLPKFWNYNEELAYVDWGSAYVLEKLDGTMIQRWWSPHTNQFEYNTRNIMGSRLKEMFVGSSYGFNAEISWQQLIDECLAGILSELEQAKNETITFEVMSPLNKVVVEHKDYKANIICRRNNNTLQEKAVIDRPFGPKAFNINNLEGCLATASELKAKESEGFVVVDANFNRVKIKGAEYVRYHQLGVDKTKSLKAIFEAVRQGEVSEVSAYFPELKPLFVEAENHLNRFIELHQQAYDQCKHIESQKEFALKVNSLNLPMSAILFLLKAGQFTTAKEVVYDMDSNKLEKYMKTFVNKESVIQTWVGE